MIAAWKLLVPLSAVAIIGAVLARNGDLPQLRGPAQASRTATLGYLTASELPNSVELLPPPPAPGSAAMQKDESARDAALQLAGTPRYALAKADANREQPNTVAAFQCAFGTEISGARTPALYRLLTRVRIDVRAATYPAKSHYKRARPFGLNNTKPCYAADAENVRDDGSYPSARAAVGWAYAYVLAELNPKRAEQIIQRGRDFGESRIVCDEEWASDVDAARTIGLATLRRSYEAPAFRADFAAAQKEVAAALKAPQAGPSCRNEAIALASR